MKPIMEPISINDLPVEILAEIAVADYGYCYREMLAIPKFGRFAIKNRKWLYQRMTMVVKVNVFSTKPTISILFGKIHKDDDYAVIGNDGQKEWWKEGKLHRDDGPAVENTDGYKGWYHHGKFHREDGPAREWPSWSRKE